MSFIGNALTTSKPSGALDPSQTIYGLTAYLAPDPSAPEQFINVRLTNGASYYTAGGTTVSGGAALSADQGSPGLLSSAWPVKLTDGSSLVGTTGNPLYFNPISGSDSARPLWVTGSIYVLNPSGGGAGGSVTAQSGSVVGLLVGGQALAAANPIPVSQQGVVSVTGTVALAQAVAISSLPSVTIANPQTTVTLISGSQTGLLVGTNPVAPSNPLPVTGTVSLAQAVTIASLPNVTVANPQTTVTVISGSQTGLLIGSNPVAGSNPLPVTGSVSLSQAIAISSLPNVTVSNPQTTVTAVSGSVTGLLYGGAPAGQANPFWVTGSVFILNQSAGGAASNVTAVSGSITGLLVGGNALSNANPVPTSIQGVATITGSVSLTQAVTVANPQTTVTAISGSVAGLLVGGLNLSNANPVPISDAGGSVTVDGTVTVSAATLISGSQTGLLVGANPVASTNPLPITGSISLSKGVDVATLPAVAQGTAAALSAPWRVQLVSGSDVVGQTTNPLWVTGSVFVINQSAGGAASNVTTVSGSITGLLVGGQALSNANPVPASVQGVATVTGSVSLSQGVAISSIPNVTIANPQTTVTTVSGSLTGLLYGGVAAGQANPFWVTGSVFVLNQGGAGSNVTALSGSTVGLLVGGVPLANSNPVPISDAGGSITVDGTVTVSAATLISGSQTGLLIGTNPVAPSNPLPVTGSVSLAQGVAITSLPTVTVANPQTTVTVVSGSIVGLLVGGLALAEGNPIPTRDQRSGTATVASLTASVTSQLLRPALTTRLGLTLYNDSVANAYLKWSGPVATNDFSFKMLPDDYYEVPYGHTGRIDVLWTSATGSMRITEFT